MDQDPSSFGIARKRLSGRMIVIERTRTALLKIRLQNLDSIQTAQGSKSYSRRVCSSLTPWQSAMTSYAGQINNHPENEAPSHGEKGQKKICSSTRVQESSPRGNTLLVEMTSPPSYGPTYAEYDRPPQRGCVLKGTGTSEYHERFSHVSGLSYSPTATATATAIATATATATAFRGLGV